MASRGAPLSGKGSWRRNESAAKPVLWVFADPAVKFSQTPEYSV